MADIVILGSGGWGIALGITAYKSSNNVTLWTPFEDEAELLRETRESPKLLKDVKIPDEIKITTDIGVAENSDITVIAVPSFAVGETAQKLSTVKNVKLVVNVAKGLEKGTCRRLSEVISEQLPNADIVVLSGPSHAEEVALCKPTSLVAVSDNPSAAEYVQETFMCDTLRVYTGDDLVGAELGGAFKNIIAVAAGICDGMEIGDNPKAALITRGLSEIARLGVALGARQETFAGLTGLGDLVVTCNSRHSRNHRFGELVGKGVSVDKALDEVGTVEGYHAAKIAYELAEKSGVEMPITRGVYKVTYEGVPASDVVKLLMTRPSRPEHDTSWLTKYL